MDKSLIGFLKQGITVKKMRRNLSAGLQFLGVVQQYKLGYNLESHSFSNSSYHQQAMADTEEQLEKILSAERKFDELKRVHQCYGKWCAICSTCFKPGEKYLIKEKEKATSTN